MRTIDPNDKEQIRVWLSGLARTPIRQLQIGCDLMRHANADDMSSEDRTFVRAAISYLRGELGHRLQAE